jgi:hypothetical protein
VIFTAYFDEADTHGSSPTIILAAHVGHAFQWRRFQTKLDKIREKYGFKIFHAKDFKARSREFSGWSDDKQAALISDLVRLVSKTLTGGFTVFLERSRYIGEYRSSPIPKKMNLDSQLGVCFRACMSHLIDLFSQNSYRDRLNIVMEHGHPNVFDCERIFNELRGYYKMVDRDLFGTFTVAAKDQCPPLMIADFLASVHSTARAAVSRGELDMNQFFASSPGKGADLTFLELTPDALRDLKTGFEEFRKIRIDHWREKRKQAASSKQA